jgi:hypothetical protein
MSIPDILEVNELRDLFNELSHRDRAMDPKAVSPNRKLLKDLVGLVGIEPTTSSMPWNWSNRKL